MREVHIIQGTGRTIFTHYNFIEFKKAEKERAPGLLAPHVVITIVGDRSVKGYECCFKEPLERDAFLEELERLWLMDLRETICIDLEKKEPYYLE